MVAYASPRAPARWNPADGPETSVLDPAPRREPPMYMTLAGSAAPGRYSPATLRAAHYRPDPRDRDQRPPREPGPAADHRGDRPDGDESRRDRGPGPHGHGPRREPGRVAVAARVRRAAATARGGAERGAARRPAAGTGRWRAGPSSARPARPASWLPAPGPCAHRTPRRSAGRRRGARAAVPLRGRDPRPRRGFAGHQAPGTFFGRRNALRVLLPSMSPRARRVSRIPALGGHGLPNSAKHLPRHRPRPSAPTARRG